jgi:hypothetical protein
MNYKRKRGIYPLPHKREDKKMKVNRPENKEYTFEELYPGDIFVYQNMICIKTGLLEEWDKEVAVDLEDGEIILDIPNGAIVEKAPDAELTWTI